MARQFTFDQINDATSFAEGAWFTSEQEVREYFTQDNMAAMFGESERDDFPQDELDCMAALVISNGWHCTF